MHFSAFLPEKPAAEASLPPVLVQNLLRLQRCAQHNNILHLHLQHLCQHDEIVDRRQRSAALPLVDGLRRVKTEYMLQVVDGKPRLFS